MFYREEKLRGYFMHPNHQIVKICLCSRLTLSIKALHSKQVVSILLLKQLESIDHQTEMTASSSLHVILNLSIFGCLLIVDTSGFPSERQRSLNEWFDFFTYLFDDSEETSDNAKTDEKYLICRNCEVIVAASEDVAHKDGIVIYKNTTTKPMELDTTEALQDPKKEEGE
ncbi:hypothetical protein GQX74_006799 [Glossina fuscipes]|nr:hypothetical protein GQX74_006799 [Glossina fuscipes]